MLCNDCVYECIASCPAQQGEIISGNDNDEVIICGCYDVIYKGD